ncbi:MAG TPA: hypothetical protein ENK85_05720 [Saprospiraceae bacterium]|nr:hypothetical protein [Saprospiraceae bacterium]
MKTNFFFIVILLCFSFLAQAQKLAISTPKEFNAVKVSSNFHIDGLAKEADWAKAPVLTDFVQWQGDVGDPSAAKTEVKVLYSDKAVYVFAKLYDQRKDIRKELAERDDIGNADFFGFFVDPFLSEIDGTEFIVSAAGTQFDAKISQNGEDNDWDAVWDSAVKIEEDGWSVEFKIPYSAIRFPSKETQDWGINFFRRIQRTKEKSSWNKVNPDIDGFVNQAGRMVGIRHIDAPLRLSATPFITAGIQTSQNGTQYSYGGGGDIKLGLNNAFTLDMTVIPDFSQTRSDEQILNISPFEIYYQERRPFFTEGTALFDKGDIIYTRRIGSQPFHYGAAFSQGNVKKNPDKSQLINAVKISGRTDKKLGIGFLNAVEARTFATLQDGEKFKTNPLTNYNAIVFDQQLKNNSSISIINSNVFREGAAQDANVTALDYDLNNKSKKWGTGGTVAVSRILAPNSTTTGHKLYINAGKRSGKLNYWVDYEETSDQYDQNDFGFLNRNNRKETSAGISYRQNKPKKLRSYSIHFNSGIEKLYKPNVFTDAWMNLNINTTTKKFFSQGAGFYLEPVNGHDYYEPRSYNNSRFFVTPKIFNFWYYFSTDYNRKLAFNTFLNYGKRDEKNAHSQGAEISVLYRFSNRLSWRIGHEFQEQNLFHGYINPNSASMGFSELHEEDIIFGRRNRKTNVTSLSVSYKLNTNMTFSFFARNYWTQLNTKGYDLLKLDGTLAETPYKGEDENGQALHNQTFDFFNIDFVYRWHFSPGSDLYLTWKNNAFNNSDQLDKFSSTLSDTFHNKTRNSLTLKVLYYLDYNSLKKGGDTT